MLLAHLAFVLLNQAPRTVTYTNPGARLERLLPELSESCGLSLLPDPKMRDVVLTLRLDQAQISDALSKIAYSTRGKWAKVGTSYVLHSDANGIARDIQADEADWRKMIDDRKATMMKALNPKTPGSPVEVAVAKLLPSLDTSAITPSMTRLVYSTQPKHLQLQLPEGSEAIIAAMFEAIRREPPDDSQEAKPPIQGMPSRANLAISYERTIDNESLLFDITLFDSEGKVILRQEAMDHPAGFVVEEQPGTSVPVFTRAPERLSHAIPLSDLDRELARLVRNGGRVSPALKSLLTSPLKHDPVELVGNKLLVYAERKHVQLAASMSDPMLRGLVGSGSEEDVWDAIECDRTKLANGWLTVERKAEDPEHQAYVADRRTLQKFVDTFVDDAHPSLITLIKSNRLGLDEIEDLPQGSLYPNLTLDNSNLCRQLALLTDDQIAALLAGDHLPLNNTPQEFRDEFVRDAFYEFAGTLSKDGDEFDFDNPIDPTELVSTKVPDTAYVVLNLETDTSFEGPPDESGSASFETLESLAEAVVSGEPIPKLRLGTQRNYELKCYLVPGISCSSSGSINETPTDAVPMSIDALPADLKVKLAKRIEEKRKAQDDDRGKSPPP